jgi:hypothetical protein
VVPLSFIGGFFLSTFFVKQMRRDFPTKNDEVGEVVFGTDSISFFTEKNNTLIELGDISRIHIHHNNYQGAYLSKYGHLCNGLARVHISNKTNEEFQFQILIKTESQFEDLKRIWKQYYLEKIPIQETLGNQKIATTCFTYLHGLSYSEVKSLKQELHLDNSSDL